MKPCKRTPALWNFSLAVSEAAGRQRTDTLMTSLRTCLCSGPATLFERSLVLQDLLMLMDQQTLDPPHIPKLQNSHLRCCVQHLLHLYPRLKPGPGAFELHPQIRSPALLWQNKPGVVCLCIEQSRAQRDLLEARSGDCANSSVTFKAKIAPSISARSTSGTRSKTRSCRWPSQTEAGSGRSAIAHGDSCKRGCSSSSSPQRATKQRWGRGDWRAPEPEGQHSVVQRDFRDSRRLTAHLGESTASL
jgi:hypothetical protein